MRPALFSRNVSLITGCYEVLESPLFILAIRRRCLRWDRNGTINNAVTLAVDAIFENGVLKPLNLLELAEHQKVHLIVETNATAPDPAHARWHWQEAQAIQDGFAGTVAEEIARQRREG